MDEHDVSLSKGGLLNNALQRLACAYPPMRRTVCQAIFFTLLAWLPLPILSALQGRAIEGAVMVPLLKDPITYARYLIAIPILITASLPIDRFISDTIRNFAETGVVPPKELPRLRDALNELIRLRDLHQIEVLILAIVFIGVASNMTMGLSQSISTWANTTPGRIGGLSLAGWWQAIVSLPLLQFLLIRWIWRTLIWALFLWRMSQLDLQLIPTHPDLAGGLGFVGLGQRGFGALGFAGSSIIASVLASRIIYEGVSPSTLRGPAAVYGAVFLLFLLGPLFIFTPHLIRSRRRGLLEYGKVAMRYTQAFDKKWVHGPDYEGSEILGTSDIQSLADMQNSFANVRSMHLVPFDLSTLLLLAATIAIPVLIAYLISQPLGTALESLKNILGKLLLGWG